MLPIKQVWRKADSMRGCLWHLRQTQGRRRHDHDEEDPLEVADCFVSDEAKLLSSKSFRVTGNKTQVFSFPRNPLIRDRKTHILEVAAVSVVASEMLGLNTNLVRASAIGHDIGHVPFGHQGEAWMARTMKRPEFCHEVMGVIIAQKIERCGRGLNLTHETLEAMMGHSDRTMRDGMSQEAWVLRYTDKFTYIFHDANDIFTRMHYPVANELKRLIDAFGKTQRERTSTAIAGLVIESAECGRVSFEDSELGRKFRFLREMMYEVYPHVTQQNVGYVMEPLLEFLMMLNIGNPFLLLALLTDKDAAALAAEPMKDMQAFNRTAVAEIAPHLEAIGPVDLCYPDLDW